MRTTHITKNSTLSIIFSRVQLSKRKHVRVMSSWNAMAHGDARAGKWRGNWRMEWVAGTLHTTSELRVSSITTADADTSAASSQLNRLPCRFKWTRPFHRKTKSGFCACAITFQMQYTTRYSEWNNVYFDDPDLQGFFITLWVSSVL